MDKSSKTLICILILAAAVVAVFIAVVGMFYPAGFAILGITPGTSYTYEVSVSADAPVYNLTLFLPLPVYKVNSPTGFGLIEGEGWGVPVNAKTGIFGEDGSLFLKMTVPEAKDLDFGITVGSDGVIDTVNPISGSYVLSPVNDLREGADTDEYSTYVYAAYDSSPGSDVEIAIYSSGENRWNGLYEKSNYFNESLSLSLSGPSKGWHPADVRLEKAMGDYSLII